MQIDELLDAARSHSRLKSDRDLAKAAGVTKNAISQFRTKRTWPADETQLRLCHLAGIDPSIGLLWLNIWRSQGRARIVYQQLSAKLGAAALSIFIGLMVFGMDSAQAAEKPALSVAYTVQEQPNSIYYGKYCPR